MITTVAVAVGSTVVPFQTVEVDVGTLEIVNPTVNLLDDKEQPIAVGIEVTGIGPPGKSVRVWFSLDTLTAGEGGTPLPRGVYFLYWRLPVSGTLDGIPRVERPVTMVLLNDL